MFTVAVDMNINESQEVFCDSQSNPCVFLPYVLQYRGIWGGYSDFQLKKNVGGLHLSDPHIQLYSIKNKDENNCYIPFWKNWKEGYVPE